jgi:hypothetical protein
VRLVACGVVLLAGACGRWSFDDVTRDDATSGGDDASDDDANQADAFVCTALGTHDEDADGVRDPCDVCPHMADANQADSDGDRVGDACDPEPAIARQQILLFDPFTSLDAAWSNSGATVSNDELVLDARGGAGIQIARPLTLTHDLFVLGMTTTTADAAPHHISVVTSPSGTGAMYCEMFDTTASTITQYTWTFDNANYNHSDPKNWGGPRLVPGTGTFAYELTPTSTRCTSIWNGTTVTSSGARPAGIADDIFHIYAEAMFTRVQWVIQIRTN